MKEYVIVEKEILKKEVANMLRSFARRLFDIHKIDKPSVDFFRELEVKDWKFDSLLDNSPFFKITSRDIVNEAAFHIISALRLQPKLDETEQAWCYTFPQEGSADNEGVLCGFGHTIDQAARAFLLNLQFCADGVNTAKDFIEGRCRANKKEDL